MEEKSYRAIMVGYAKNHSADTTDCIIQQKRSITENRDDVAGLDQAKPSEKFIYFCD
jgi:hypothetical protein